MSDYLRCPECKGRCCRDHYGYRIKHMDAEFYEHTCDACYDGTKYTAPRSPEEERADVVAYLRQRIEMEMEQLQVLEQTSKWVEAIERGEHVGWSKDDTSRKAILDREHYKP